MRIKWHKIEITILMTPNKIDASHTSAPYISPYHLFEATNHFQENGLSFNYKGKLQNSHEGSFRNNQVSGEKKNHSKQSSQSPKNMANSLELFKLLSHFELFAAASQLR